MIYLELFALEDVAICTTGLTWSAGDGGVETTSVELCGEGRLDFSIYVVKC